ncbi:MAG: hypothetical protein JW750_00895 [Anaerolineaceae bacterium]|nr:hypothetical protein [Anaerolineaceae bacterium]
MMKKQFVLAFAILLTTFLFFSAAASPVFARESSRTFIPTPEVEPGPAEGEWVITDSSVSGTIVYTADLTTPPPNEWMQLKSNGIHVSGSTKICHPFSGGQFGWTTSVFLLEGNHWTEILTTMEWVPDEEGHLEVCAYAPVSGTYALFAYWEWYEGYMEYVPRFSLSIEPLPF